MAGAIAPDQVVNGIDIWQNRVKIDVQRALHGLAPSRFALLWCLCVPVMPREPNRLGRPGCAQPGYGNRCNCGGVEPPAKMKADTLRIAQAVFHSHLNALAKLARIMLGRWQPDPTARSRPPVPPFAQTFATHRHRMAAWQFSNSAMPGAFFSDKAPIHQARQQHILV